MAATESIKGTIENVVYYNEETDYAVLEVSLSSGLYVTAVGTVPIPAEGECVILGGKWGYHKEFGKQFLIETFEKTLPLEEEGILQYLSSHVVKGVGPTTAKKIVDRFGKDTFEIIEHHPEWLADISGITLKKAAAISESFREQNGLRGVVMFCKDYMGIGEATKVYKKLGNGAVGMITDNPYILCDGDFGIPFSAADEIAMSIGFPKDSDKRVLSGLKYVLEYNATANGHTCLPKDKLVLSAVEVLGIPKERIDELLDRFLNERTLKSYRSGDAEYVMTAEIDEAENYIASKLVSLDQSAVSLGYRDVGALVEKIEVQNGIRYDNLQKQAIYEALRGGVMVLTGGPGTGKTTVVKALLSIFSSLGMKTVLAAPTGRAAKRMSEATSEEAKTIHRMLEMERDADRRGKFGRNTYNPLDENVVIVDEASMIDTLLMHALLRAMKRGSRLVLIGDSSQLPSVGAGNVLSDIIASERVRTVKLTEIFRQASESLIVTNAHKINAGEQPYLGSVSGDFFFVRREREGEISPAVVELIMKRLPKSYGRTIADRIQVITPSKKGAGGVDKLNVDLQAAINPGSPYKSEKSAHGTLFREGDKVMQTANNYELEWERGNECGMGVFNGDIGVIKRINLKEQHMVIEFDERRVKYGFDILDELELAYAITVHKSQGSEYPVVILPLYSCAPMLMTRNLLYTAVTRARQMVIMVGRTDIVYKMVNNNSEVQRYTTLSERIVEYS